MAARRMDTGGAQEAEVCLVPALVQHNGPAAIGTYFQPKETGNTVDGRAVLECSLRGRTLAGIRLPLPAGFSGAVLEPPPGGQGDGGEEASWQATAAFTSLTYFNHDAVPLKGDGLQRCLEWSGLAAQLHAPVDPAAVAAKAAGTPPPGEGA